jgi:RNA polymerase sigma factor (sigma-70 family)
VRTLAVAHRPTSAPDGVLVQEAAAGGGESYAALYDRYAEQVYNYCLRLTGSPDDAADATQDAFVNVLRRLQDDDRPVLDFSSYLFAAARNESYALMRRRARTHPVDEPPELAGTMVAAAAVDVETDPERSVLIQDSQEQVRQANAQLAPRHREVLALREVAGRSYDEIGQIMGISENAAAQLIWRARAKMKEALTAGAVASVVAATEDCETAQLLLNRLEDGEPITDEEQEWLDEHLDECGSCRAARGLIFEVGASYRAWAPVGVLAAMKPEVLTQAGHVVGADWSGIAGKAGVSQATVGGAATGVAVLAAAGIAISGIFGDDADVARKAIPIPEKPAVAKPAPKPKPKAAKPKPAKPPPVKVASVQAAKAAAAAPEPLKQVAKQAPPSATPPAKPKPPAPKAPPPAPKTNPAPPPAAPTGCTFPGHGNGPGGCPPGHGGTPPGQGAPPPGRVGKTSTPPAQTRTPPGQVGKTHTPPGQVGKKH